MYENAEIFKLTIFHHCTSASRQKSVFVIRERSVLMRVDGIPRLDCMFDNLECTGMFVHCLYS